MAIYSEFSHEKWWFSIVMLVYQRVTSLIPPLVAIIHISRRVGATLVKVLTWNQTDWNVKKHCHKMKSWEHHETVSWPSHVVVLVVPPLCSMFVTVCSCIPSQQLASYIRQFYRKPFFNSSNGFVWAWFKYTPNHGPFHENWFPSKRLLRIHHFQVDPVQVCVFHLADQKRWENPAPTDRAFLWLRGDHVWLRGGVLTCAI